MRNTLLEANEGSPLHYRHHWTEVYSAYVNNILTLAILIITLLFLLLEMSARTNAGINTAAPVDIVYMGATRIESTDCDDGDTCTRDFKFVEADFCEHVLEPAGTPCVNNCYITDATTTACEVNGTCIGNATECRGYCNTDAECVGMIPFNDQWLSVVATWDESQVLVWRHQHICEFNRCNFFLMLNFADPSAVGSNNYAQPIGVGTCLGFLNTTFAAESGQCLDVRDHLLYTNITSMANQPSEVNSPPQFRMCAYYYHCATLNQTAIQLVDAGSFGVPSSP